MIYLLTLLVITIFVFWLHKDIDNTFNDVYRSFVTNEITLTGELAENIEKRIAGMAPDHPVERLRNDPKLRHDLDNLLSLFSTPHFRYVYLLVEKKGGLRYLSDGSREVDQRGLFGQ